MILFRTIRRWLKHRAQRDFELKSTPRYWLVRNVAERLQHQLSKRHFYARQAAREAGQSARILFSLSRAVLKDVLFAAVVFSIAVLADHFLQLATASLAPHYPTVVAKLAKVSAALTTNYEQVQNILNTVVQLAGIFLTLYFTAVSLIASTVYSRVPGDVRALAVEEKVGNTYMRFVAMLGAFAMMYILGGVVGLRIGLVGITTVGVLSISSLFCFLFLGKRSFNFFQPAVLIDYLVGDLADWIRLSASPKRRFQSRSLQNHYRVKAENALTTYRNIVSLATKEDYYRIEPQALVMVMKLTVHLAAFYASQKSRIPSKSFWFERVNKHKDWLTVGHTELGIALDSGRPVDPEQISNFLWVEERLQIALRTASTALTSRLDSHEWFQVANQLYQRLEELAGYFSVEEGLLLFRAQRGEIQLLLAKTDLQPGVDSEEANQRLSFCVGAVSFVVADLMAILIGFVRRIENLGAEAVEDVARALTAGQTEDIYSKQLPRTVLTEAEWIAEAINAERSAEGRLVTPTWFVSQLLARAFIQYIKATGLALVKELEETFHARLESLEKAQRHLFVAQAISSGIEACDKFHVHLSAMESCVERLNTLRKVQDVPWVDIDWKEQHARIGAVHSQLMASASRILPLLSAVPRTRYWPDYFGQLYSFVAREAYHAMTRGDDGLFEKIFLPLFFSSFLANQKLREDLSDKDANVMLAWSSGPILDIVTLSGYAKLFTELDGKPFYGVVTKTWDSHLATLADPTILLKRSSRLRRFE